MSSRDVSSDDDCSQVSPDSVESQFVSSTDEDIQTPQVVERKPHDNPGEQTSCDICGEDDGPFVRVVYSLPDDNRRFTAVECGCCRAAIELRNFQRQEGTYESAMRDQIIAEHQIMWFGDGDDNSLADGFESVD